MSNNNVKSEGGDSLALSNVSEEGILKYLKEPFARFCTECGSMLDYYKVINDYVFCRAEKIITICPECGEKYEALPSDETIKVKKCFFEIQEQNKSIEEIIKATKRTEEEITKIGKRFVI